MSANQQAINIRKNTKLVQIAPPSSFELSILILVW